MTPLPIFTWIHTGKWAIGLPRSGPVPAAPVPGGMDPAPRGFPALSVMGSLDTGAPD